MIVTNIRIVWFAVTNTKYNVSIPYLQAKNCRIRHSRFGLALVIETSAVVCHQISQLVYFNFYDHHNSDSDRESLQNKDYVLGFRADPEERLKDIHRTISALQKAYATKPIFGVQYVREMSV